MLRIFPVIILFLLLFPAVSFESGKTIREDFNTIQSWKPLNFPKIKEHSVYSIVREEENNILKCEADASASGLLYIHSFNTKDHRILKWKWKISNIYKKGDATKKEGDDYPLRVYIIFKYDPSRASFFEKAKYNAAKLIYGEYPPHSSLNYIWANKSHKRKIIPNPFTNKAMMIIMETGDEKAGKWVVEKVNIAEDYMKVFGEEIPEKAGLAIMCDADNTGEKAVSWMDYIELTGN